MAEHEMPGLMTLRRKYGAQKPLAGARFRVVAYDHRDGGANRDAGRAGRLVRWASCNIFSTQDQAGGGIAQTGVSVFAFKGESLESIGLHPQRPDASGRKRAGADRG